MRRDTERQGCGAPCLPRNRPGLALQGFATGVAPKDGGTLDCLDQIRPRSPTAPLCCLQPQAAVLLAARTARTTRSYCVHSYNKTRFSPPHSQPSPLLLLSSLLIISYFRQKVCTDPLEPINLLETLPSSSLSLRSLSLLSLGLTDYRLVSLQP